METELQQAERTAKAWLKWPAVPEVATLARVFLAQQARLAEVERERDHWRSAWKGADVVRRNAFADRNAAERSREHWERRFEEEKQARLAAERKATEAVEARRVGLFTDGATWLAGRLGHNASAIVMTQYEAAEEARRRYPAPTEREGAQECPCGRVRQLCGTVGCSNPALRARPALPADVQAVVERLRGHLVRLDDGDYTDMPDVVQDVSALLAHLQRQDTP